MLSTFPADLAVYNDHFLLAGRFSTALNNNLQVAEIDTSFTVLNNFNLDSISYVNNYAPQVIGIENNFADLVQAGTNSYYVTGVFDFNQSPQTALYAKTVSAIIKNNHQVTHSQVIGKDSINTSCYINSTTSKRYNFIYSAATEGPYSNHFVPGSNCSRMLVHKMDTAGNLLWAIYFGGDKYYEPWSVCATADSGVVIAGMRYDTIAPAVPGACEGFVMKLGKQGDREFVGIMDHGKLNTSYHACYPNPAHDELFFDVPFEQEFEVSIYSASGSEMLKATYKNRSALTLSSLVNGSYTYKLKTKSGKFYSGKFINE